uniref:Uncharacterized protein n=1 Tax=Strigamia maritima TaxID=126957 RepID=T1JEH5_STRMM
MIGRSLLIHLFIPKMKKNEKCVTDLEAAVENKVVKVEKVEENEEEISEDELMLDAPKVEPGITILPRMPKQGENSKCSRCSGRLQHPITSTSANNGQLKELMPNRVTPDTSGLTIPERDKARYVREKGVYKPKRNAIGTKGKRKPLKQMPIRPRQVLLTPVKHTRI